MEYTKQGRRNRTFIIIWTIAVIGFIYLPVLCDALSSLSKGRYFMFPIKKWGLDWWTKTANSIEISQLVSNSLLIAFFVTILSTIIAFCGALAFARFSWKGKKMFQKIILMPVFFPQPVLGLENWYSSVMAYSSICSLSMDNPCCYSSYRNSGLRF